MTRSVTRTQQVAEVVIDMLIGAYLWAAAWFIIIPALIPWMIPEDGLGYVMTALSAIINAAIGASGSSIGRLLLTGSMAQGKHRILQVNTLWSLFLLTILSGWIITDISPVEFFSAEGLKGAGRIFGALATPQFDIVAAALRAMVETIYIALMSTVIAVPIAFVLSFPAARNVMWGSAGERIIYTSLRAVLNIIRSMEPIIWAIIFSVWVGIGPFAGMLALALHTVASLTKLFSEQIESVSDGPIEAISATGAKRLQVLWFAIVPQCVLPFMSFTIYRWDINVRMATIIGFVGGGGIGTLLTQYQGLSKFHEIGTLVIIITLVVWLLDIISARIRAALR